MREPGMYWIKYEFQDAGLLGGTIVAWEAVYWDGDFFMMTGSDTDHNESDAVEWGPRIYPPDHVFKEEPQAYDYDERRLPESN